MSFFAPQNPGIGGLEELTNAEEIFLTTFAGLSYNEGDVLTVFGGNPTWKPAGAGSVSWGGIAGTLSNQTDLQNALNAKQATLVSGTNIKTINGNTLLGSGDITISSSVSWGNITGTLSSQTDLNSALAGKSDTSHTHTGVYQPVMGADDNYVTDAEKLALHSHANKIALDNVSGVNTGDQDLSGYSLTSHLHTGVYAPASHIHSEADITGLTTDLANKVTANTAITGATKTKITYDAKGLVTTGADATTADIADSTNKRYVTDANLTVIGNTSGTNTGDQIIKDVFGITVDGGGSTPTTGTKGYRYIEQNCTITGWHVQSDVSGSVIFNVKRGGTSIAGTEKPTLTSQQSNSDTTLTTWTTSLTAGDIIEFVIDSASTLTRATLTVLVTKN